MALIWTSQKKWNLDATFKIMHLHNYDVSSNWLKVEPSTRFEGKHVLVGKEKNIWNWSEIQSFINLKLTLQRWGNLHLTITITVWLTASPTPLKAVQRYVPLELLLILAMTKYPSLDCIDPLSAPLSRTLVQVIFGSGLPVALQLKVTSECSQTSWSLVTPTTWGRSTNNQVIKEDWDEWKRQNHLNEFCVFTFLCSGI